MNRAVVIAHFHPAGRVQASLRALVPALLALPSQVVFVSTNASPEALRTLPSGVQAIERRNAGYDFESYRVGIAALGDVGAFDELVLMNSSIVCVDARKLCERFFAAPRAPGMDLFALTASREVAPHLQSFLVGFSRRALVSATFAAWWRELEAVDERDEVIGRYELGMSMHFARHGFGLAAAFHPTPAQKLRALCRYFEAGGDAPPIDADGTVAFNVNGADVLNPMHFLWDAILEEFGVLKVELLKRNPNSLDLRMLSRRLLHDAAFRELVQDVLEEPALSPRDAATISSSRAGSPRSAT